TYPTRPARPTRNPPVCQHRAVDARHLAPSCRLHRRSPRLSIGPDEEPGDNEEMLSRPPGSVTARRFASNADADRADAAYWQSISDADRIALVWTLSRDLWELRGE